MLLTRLRTSENTCPWHGGHMVYDTSTCLVVESQNHQATVFMDLASKLDNTTPKGTRGKNNNLIDNQHRIYFLTKDFPLYDLFLLK
jgi:hypothetical protein